MITRVSAAADAVAADDPLGPVDLFVIEFPDRTAAAAGLPPFIELVDRGVIRVYDLIFIRKDLGGAVVQVDLADVGQHGQPELRGRRQRWRGRQEQRPRLSHRYLPAGTTPASKPTAHAGESRPAIRSPSAASRRFDRREVLRSDVIGPARGLRVGGEDRRSCEQQCDRKGERDFAHQVSP